VTFQTTDQPTAVEHIRPFRALIGFALLGAAGLGLLQVLWAWLVSSHGTSPPFDQRSLEAASQFTSLHIMALPLIAVLITTMIAPVVPQAKQITLVALVEYGVIALGTLITTVVGLGVLLEHPAGIMINFLLHWLVMLTLLGLAGFVVLRIYLGSYPKTAPTAAYGGGYPVQPYPGYPQPGYPQPAAATAQQAAAQQAAAQQAQYAQHGQHHPQASYQHSQQSQPTAGYGYAAPPPASPATAPGAATPTSGAPDTAPPAPTQPGPESEATRQYSAEPPQRATGWPPTPGTGGSPWPPTPGADSGQREDPAQTQAFRPDPYRGNAPG
jgi:hypothetical protein